MGRQLLVGPRSLVFSLPVLLLLPGAAQAEDPPAQAEAPQEASVEPPERKKGAAEMTEEIVVTGSRIPRKDLTTPAPVTTFTRRDIVESGRVSIGEFLQLMPEQANAMNRNVNNGGDGSIRVSLRGAGENRTLVLLNGRRLVTGGNGANDSVDLTSIPAAAVERVEVLKDGASPVYGSDAIAGVVNIITRRAWSGTEASAYTGASARGDGFVLDASMTTGRTSEGGSLMLSVGYTRQDAIWSGDRDWATNAWNLDMTGDTSPLGVPGPYAVGSPVTPAGRIFTINRQGGTPLPNPGGDPRIDLYNQLVTTYPSATSFVPDPSEPLGWRPWRGGALPEYGGDQYNFQPANYLVTPSERLSLFATGELDLGGRTRAFFETSYVDRQSSQWLAPEPLIGGYDGVTFSAENPYNPFGVDLTDFYRRIMELGNRKFSEEVQTIRVLGGFSGTLPDGAGLLRGWGWEASAAYGRSNATSVKAGYTRISAVRDALGPAFVDVDGVLRCGTAATGAIPGCVPLDLFSQAGPITPEQISALTFEGTSHGENVLSTLQVGTTGPLFSIVDGRPAELSIGYDYRVQSGTYVPDPVTASLDASTDGFETRTHGTQDAHEAYAELSIPLADGKRLAHRLEVLAAARAFRYSGFGADWTWKLGARWAPVADVTLRGTLSTAFRAPSIWELYFGESGGSGTVSDPCAGIDDLGNPVPVSPWCPITTGVPTPIVAFRASGNTSLRPETARVWTAGVVLEPRFLRPLSLAVDLYGIRIANTISWVDPLALCYPMTTDVQPMFCSLVSRDPTTGVLTGIEQTPVNAGTEDTYGVDLAGQYAVRAGAGALRFTAAATWLGRYDFLRPDGSVVHAKGNYDSLVGSGGYMHPEWKFNAGIAWALRGFAAGASVRYIGSFKECADDTGVFGPGGLGGGSTYCSFDHAWERTVSAYAAYDAFLSYGFTSAAGRTDLIAGVRNLFDTSPPRVYWANPSDPGYDFVGRFAYIRLAQRF